MRKFQVFMAALTLLIMSAPAIAAGGDVPRITKEELKAKLEKGEDIVILDVRTRGSYDGSKIKIKGSVRIVPDDIETRLKDIPQGKEIITYCT